MVAPAVVTRPAKGFQCEHGHQIFHMNPPIYHLLSNLTLNEMEDEFVILSMEIWQEHHHNILLLLITKGNDLNRNGSEYKYLTRRTTADYLHGHSQWSIAYIKSGPWRVGEGNVTIFPILSFFVILSFSCLIIRHMVTMMILHLFLISHAQHYTCCILSYALCFTCLFLAYTTCLPCLLLAVVAWIFTI